MQKIHIVLYFLLSILASADEKFDSYILAESPHVAEFDTNAYCLKKPTAVFNNTTDLFSHLGGDITVTLNDGNSNYIRCFRELGMSEGEMLSLLAQSVREEKDSAFPISVDDLVFMMHEGAGHSGVITSYLYACNDKQVILYIVHRYIVRIKMPDSDIPPHKENLYIDGIPMEVDVFDGTPHYKCADYLVYKITVENSLQDLNSRKTALQEGARQAE